LFDYDGLHPSLIYSVLSGLVLCIARERAKSVNTASKPCVTGCNNQKISPERAKSLPKTKHPAKFFNFVGY
jgi:hypothetical protein